MLSGRASYGVVTRFVGELPQVVVAQPHALFHIVRKCFLSLSSALYPSWSYAMDTLSRHCGSVHASFASLNRARAVSRSHASRATLIPILLLFITASQSVLG